MKKLLSTFLCLMPFLAWTADINETNIPIATIGAVTTNDYIRILTNCAVSMANGKTRLLKVGDLLSLVPASTGGAQVWTNDGIAIYPLTNDLPVIVTPDTGGSYHLGLGTLQNYVPNPNDQNIAIGNEALRDLISGDDNIAIGFHALYQQTTNIYDGNVAIGVYSLSLLTNENGQGNVAIGQAAGSNIGSQNRNTFVGDDAGDTYNPGGTNEDCVAVGYYSLNNMKDVNGLTAVGTRSLEHNSTGIQNVGIGYYAGNTISTGTHNTFLGYQADGTAGVTNSGAIGANATVSKNNQMVIGTMDVTTVCGNGVLYPSNTVAMPTAAILGVGGYWTGNSNGFLVTVYSLDGSTTVMKVLAP